MYYISVSLHQSTPLYIAVRHGLIDVVMYLVSKGADMSISNDDKVSKQHYTSENTLVLVIWVIYSKETSTTFVQVNHS